MTREAHTSDETLAAQSAQDVRARERLFQRHVGPVTHYLMQQFTGIEFEAVASEAVLTTLDYVGRHRLKKSFVAVLYRVAMQQAWKARQQTILRGRHEVAFVECPEQTARLRQADPEERVLADITLATALNRLTPQERETLLLRYVDELSEAEIVAKQGRTLHAVKSSLYHARQKLRADADLRPPGYAMAGAKPAAMAGAKPARRKQTMSEMKSLNLDFEEGRKVTGWPKSWGGGGQGYAFTTDENAPHSGQYCGRIEYVGPASSSGFGTLTQCIPVGEYADKRVRYAGWLKSQGAAEWGGLWMRVDGANTRSLAFDNMQNRGIKGTTDWTRYEIVLDVAPEATQICFGFLLSDAGILWGDDLTIEVVSAMGEGPPTTGFSTGSRQETSSLDAAQVTAQITAMQAEIAALKEAVARLESGAR